MVLLGCAGRACLISFHLTSEVNTCPIQENAPLNFVGLLILSGNRKLDFIQVYVVQPYQVYNEISKYFTCISLFSFCGEKICIAHLNDPFHEI